MTGFSRLIKYLTIALVLTVYVTGFAARCTAEEEFLIGLIPEENIFRQIKRHRPLAAYLSNKLGVKVRFTVLSRYGDIVDRFVSREMDGAFFGIFTAALAVERLDVEPVVRPVNPDGSTTAKGYLITRKDSGINSFEDMRGKRMAFVDRATATGYLFAVAYLKEHGVENLEEFFSEYTFTGSHYSSIYAVLDGRADVGMAKSRILDTLSKKDPVIQEEIHIIAESEELPDTTLCIRRDAPPELKEKLKEALLSLDESTMGLQVLEKLGKLRFVEATEADFETVKALSEKAGIDIKQYGFR